MSYSLNSKHMLDLKDKEKPPTITFCCKWFIINCGPTWARTRDSLIMSQVL
jgi:hypothetical protein